MSRTETKEVTYLDGNWVRIGGKTYSAERTCRNSNGEWLASFKCSECGTVSSVSRMPNGSSMSWVHHRNPPFCPFCGAEVVS